MAAVVVAGLTACQGPGPVEYGRSDGGSAEVCFPAGGAAWLVGDSFRTGDEPVRVDDIELVGASDIELVGSWLTTPEGAIGAVRYPPDTEVDWNHAVEAVGAEVAAGTEQGFAVAVRATGDEGTVRALAITYTVDGRQYRVEGTLGIRAPCQDGAGSGFL